MDDKPTLQGAGTLTGQPGRYVVRFERSYPRSRDELWQAISSPAGLDAWYPTKLRTDGVVGNRVEESFEVDGAPPEAAPPGTLTAYDPPTVFEYRVKGLAEAPHAGMLGTQTIRMEALPGAREGESRLLFTHEVETLPTALDVLGGWHYCLDYLALHLGVGDAPTPEGHELAKRYYQEAYGSFGGGFSS